MADTKTFNWRSVYHIRNYDLHGYPHDKLEMSCEKLEGTLPDW